jgi:hypothetical protein
MVEYLNIQHNRHISADQPEEIEAPNKPNEPVEPGSAPV